MAGLSLRGIMMAVSLALAPGTAAAARLPVMALRRESGAERAATVAGSKTMIDFIAATTDVARGKLWQRVGYAKVSWYAPDVSTVL